MPFQNGHGIVQRKAQRHREEGEKEFYIIHKIVETAPLYTFIGKPIANKQDYGAEDKKAGNLEHPSQMAVCVFYVEHGNAQ